MPRYVGYLTQSWGRTDEAGMTDAILSALERLGASPLGPEERGRLLDGAAGAGVRRVEADRDLLRAGERAPHFALLLDGLACRYRALEDGRRQIVAFHVPGELCDPAGLRAAALDCATATLAPAAVALVPRASVLGAMERRPRLREALWRAALADAALSREWVVNLGRRTAHQRTAHLLCELAQRLRASAGAGTNAGTNGAGANGAGRGCERGGGRGAERGWEHALPLTQSELADALGLTPVHVGRVLQDLRARGLAEFGSGRLAVRDWAGLRHAGGFDGAYLDAA